jgi:hypothetical protein
MCASVCRKNPSNLTVTTYLSDYNAASAYYVQSDYAGAPTEWSGLNWLTEWPKQRHLDSSGQRHNAIVWGDWRLDLHNSTVRHEAELELHGRRRFLCHVPHSRDSGRSQLHYSGSHCCRGGALPTGEPKRWLCVSASPRDGPQHGSQLAYKQRQQIRAHPRQQRLVDIGPLLVAHSQSAELI